MSDWFTSKLRVAENILHKIDQQAAESLRKNEKGALDGVDVDSPGRPGSVTATAGSIPLKEQFKKKAFDGGDHVPRVVNNLPSGSNRDSTSKGVGSGSGSVTRSNSSSARNSDAAEGDWTELLGSPTSPATASPRTRGNGAGSRGGRNNLATEFKRNPKMTTARMKAQKKLGPGVSGEAKVNGIEKNEGNTLSSSLEGAIPQVDLRNPGNLRDIQAFEKKCSVSVTEQVVKDVSEDNVATLNFTDRRSEDKSCSRALNGSRGKESLSASNLVHVVDQHGLRRSSGGSLLRDANAGDTIGSELGTDSGSSSDSRSEAEWEREERRRRRQKLLAEKVAAKAVEYIRDRENLVAKLEGEKQSLEKMVEERAKQQVKEKI